MDDERYSEAGILRQYAHLKSMHQAMPVIRKLLGLSEYGQLPDTAIGRTLQRFVANDRQNAVCEVGSDINKTLES